MKSELVLKIVVAVEDSNKNGSSSSSSTISKINTPETCRFGRQLESKGPTRGKDVPSPWHCRWSV